MNLYSSIFEALNTAEVEYLIVGGVAVNLHGYSRFTGDIDIIITLSKPNLLRLDTIMKQLGYTERLPLSVLDLADTSKVEAYVKDKEMKAYTYISSDKPQLDLDIVVTESLNFKDYKSRAELINVWDLNLPVVNIDDLIGMKRSAGRDQDLLDLEALLKLKEL